MDIRSWHEVVSGAQRSGTGLSAAAGEPTRLLALMGPNEVLKGDLFDACAPQQRVGAAVLDGFLLRHARSATIHATVVQCNDGITLGTPLYAKNVTAATLLADVVVWCACQLPKREELLQTLHDAVQLGGAVAPRLQKGGKTLGSHLVVAVACDAPALLSGDEEARLLRWLLHIEATYSDAGHIRLDALRRNELRVAIVDAFESAKVILVPTPTESHYRDKLRAVALGEHINGRLGARVVRPVDPDAVIERLATLPLAAVDESWGALQRAWMLERAAAVVTEDFSSHLDVRRARLTRAYVEEQRERVMQRCAAMVAAATSSEDERHEAMASIVALIEPAHAVYVAVADEAQKALASSGGAPSSGAMGATRRGIGGRGGEPEHPVLLWLQDRLPQQHRFWATKQGLIVIAVLLLFLIGSWASLRSGGGKVVAPKGISDTNTSNVLTK